MSTARLEATALTKRFTRGATVIRAVEELDLTIGAGELVVVTGPSLSGKTTLVELLAGWRRPDRGRVTWNGATEPPPWSALTVVPQALALIDEITVVENIRLADRIDRSPVGAGTGGGGAGTEQVGRLDRLLRDLGLERLRDRQVSEISVGEQQRAMVARALLDRPGIILADEPVAHQDEQHADAVLGLLRAATVDGAAAVIATRRPDVVAGATRVVTLEAPGSS